jgi:integrase
LEPLIQGAKGELKALLLTFQIQGWRVTETLMLRRDKIDWKRSQVMRWVTKSKQWRVAAVDRDVLRAWAKLAENPDGRMFSIRNRYQLYRQVDGLIESLGLEMHYRPHRSRRGFATALFDEGYGLDQIRDAGQWVNRETVAVYVRDNPERARPVLAVLRGRAKGKGAKSA